MAKLLALALAACAGTFAVATAQEITVKAEKPPSDLLRPPGTTTSDPYKPAVDWASIPPWRKTEFFGIRAQGKTFLYVVDCSGSMGEKERLARAKREIRRSVGELRFPQRFQIIFYNDQAFSMPGVPESVDLSTKTHLSQWLETIDADGGTDPRSAMFQALAQKPDAIFLLSDGEFPKGVVEAIAKKNAAKTPVHCVDLSGKSADLKRIAKDSGGDYASRP